MRKKQNRIIIRQPIESKVIYMAIIIFLCSALAAFFIYSTELGRAMILPVGISLLIVTSLLLYVFLWKITLTSDGIAYHFFSSGKFSYAHIIDIKQYSTGLWGDRIWIDFSNGKRLTFTSRYLNYSEAVRELKKHCPIHHITGDI